MQGVGTHRGTGTTEGIGPLNKETEGSRLVTSLCHLLQMDPVFPQDPSETEKKMLSQKKHVACLPRERTLPKIPTRPPQFFCLNAPGRKPPGAKTESLPGDQGCTPAPQCGGTLGSAWLALLSLAAQCPCGTGSHAPMTKEEPRGKTEQTVCEELCVVLRLSGRPGWAAGHCRRVQPAGGEDDRPGVSPAGLGLRCQPEAAQHLFPPSGFQDVDSPRGPNST